MIKLLQGAVKHSKPFLKLPLIKTKNLEWILKWSANSNSRVKYIVKSTLFQQLIFSRRFYIIKEPDYYGHSVFSFLPLRQSRMRRNFCSVCSTQRIPWNRIKVIGKSPSFGFFLLFNRNIQNRTRLNGSPFQFFLTL